jgi:hypothetical protein
LGINESLSAVAGSSAPVHTSAPLATATLPATSFSHTSLESPALDLSLDSQDQSVAQSTFNLDEDVESYTDRLYGAWFKAESKAAQQAGRTMRKELGHDL